MVWVKIDDGFVENEKVHALSDRAFRFHVAGMCYCGRHLTDGLITARAAKVLAVTTEKPAKSCVSELEKSGLWLLVEGGHVIKDYLEYNPDASTVKGERARNAARQQGLRKRRNEVRDEVCNALHTEVRHGGSHAAPSPTPVKDLKPLLALASTQPLNPGQDSRESGERQPRMHRLLDACRVPGPARAEAEVKFFRALKGASEGDVVAAIEAASSPKTVDRLGMALSVLKKRKAVA